jgi:hypothetical protein
LRATSDAYFALQASKKAMGGVDSGEKSDSAPDTARTRRNKTYLLLVLAIQRLLANWLVSGDERQKMTLQPEGYTKTGDFFSALLKGQSVRAVIM